MKVETQSLLVEENSENEMDDQSELSEQVSEQLSHDDSSASGHPFPTPPPDDPVASTSHMAMSKNLAKKNLLSWAEEAIKAQGSRSGSSVSAIIKYMKSAGYEVTEERKLSKLLYRQLKRAAVNGRVVQVKFSFKLPVAVKNPKSIEKMKKRVLEKKLAKKQETEPTEQVVIAKTKKEKIKSTAPKTTETAKKKKMADLTATAEDVREKPKKQSSKLKAKEPAINKKKGDLAADELEKSKMAKKAKKEKAKPPRVSIGTLAHPSGKPKIQVAAIKKLTAGRAGPKNAEDTDPEMDSNPNFTSTPVASERKRKGRLRK